MDALGIVFICAGLFLLIATCTTTIIEKLNLYLEVSNDVSGNKILVLWYTRNGKRQHKTWTLKRVNYDKR